VTNGAFPRPSRAESGTKKWTEERKSEVRTLNDELKTPAFQFIVQRSDF
jgi:hypothetical protein